MNIQSDRALVLKRHPYSETSLVVTVLTRMHGLVQILARGAYRPRSRFYAVLDLFHELELEWVPSKRSELANLRRGDLVRRRKSITDSLETYRCATSLLELSGLGARPGHREKRLFDQLSKNLDQLCVVGCEPNRVRIEFELAFLQLHGLSPALQKCAGCGKPAPAKGQPPRVGFAAGAGGRVCEACAADTRAGGGRAGTLPLDVVELAGNWGSPESDAATPEQLVRTRDFIERFLDYHLGTRPRSHRTFLSADNRNAAQAILSPR